MTVDFMVPKSPHLTENGINDVRVWNLGNTWHYNFNIIKVYF